MEVEGPTSDTVEWDLPCYKQKKKKKRGMIKCQVVAKKDHSFTRLCEYLLCGYIRGGGQSSHQFYSGSDTWLIGARELCSRYAV